MKVVIHFVGSRTLALFQLFLHTGEGGLEIEINISKKLILILAEQMESGR